jgi:signal transduction histidine kinase
MALRSQEDIRKVTRELGNEILREQLEQNARDEFKLYPNADDDRPIWRLRFDLTYNSAIYGGVDLNGEVVLGREQDVPGFADICLAGNAEQLGVSRRHAMLRPTESKLYLIDLGSTNGTSINGHSIGVNMPYSLSNGDIVRLGRMEFTVSILKHPEHSAASSGKADIFDILPTIARCIASQLELKEVLKQTLAMAMTYTPSDEVSVWLVDEHSGELFLEAELGMDGEQVRRLPVADTLAGQVIRQGKPVCVNRTPDGDPVKIKTGYLVEAVIYVPLILGGATFGVLSAAHREKGKLFSRQDEKMMVAIANITAVAVQNARVHQATARALSSRTKVLAAVSYTLANTFRGLVRSTVGNAGLLQSDGSLNHEQLELTSQIVETGDAMIALIRQLQDAVSLTEDSNVQHAPFDLADVTLRAVEDLRGFADEKAIQLDYQIMGNTYLIEGDSPYIYRAILNLVDNAIRYSPNGSQVSVMLVYGHQEIILRVRDTGPGIPENDLPYLFERYMRGEDSSGLGLGLHQVYTAVEAHQGTVTVCNTESHGAEFTITLPGKLRID